VKVLFFSSKNYRIILLSLINAIFYLVCQLRKLMKRLVLCPLLIPLLSNLSSSEFVEKNCWEKCLKQNDLLPRNDFFPNDIRATNKCAFGIKDGDIWKIELEKMIPNIINSNSDELNNDNSDKSKNINLDEIFDQLHINLQNSYMNTIKELFEEVILSEYIYDSDDPVQGFTKWRIINNDSGVIELQIREKNNVNNIICTRVERFKMDCKGLHGIKLLSDNNDNDIIILAKYGLLIYHFNENDKSISLDYFYKEYLHNIDALPHYRKKVFSKPTLPLPNYESFECNDEWVLNVKNNKESLLKYGVELLSFAIKKYKLELMDEIYKKCLGYFKQDFSNKMFLSIITSTMPLLNEYYPEYILRYSSETIMIIDSPSYSIEYQNNNLHLFSFQYPQTVNITRSITWFKYNLFMDRLYEIHTILFIILIFIQSLVVLLILPILYILSEFNLIDNFTTHELFSKVYFKVTGIFSKSKETPTTIFMNPYVKFVNYPKDYDRLSDFFKPQPSPFVETINRDIYKTWNGESLINFKWDKYGKYYYAIIWIVFMAFLGCFTVAATVPHIDDDVRSQLLITSIILGFIHLIFEVRQFIYNPIKWVNDFWNIFGIYYIHFQYP
jgi:hypothetical protein